MVNRVQDRMIAAFASHCGAAVPPQWLLDEAKQDVFLDPLTLDRHGVFLPIKHAGKYVGFMHPCAVLGDKISVGTLFVSERYRNRGLAAKALKRAIDIEPDIVSFVHVDNHRSIRAHEAAGFRSGTIPSDWPDGWLVLTGGEHA